MQPQLFPYSPERDVYRLLQVEPSAAPEEITAAVRRLARTFHPDRNRSMRATQEMQVVNAVRSLLIDPYARATYDRARHRFLDENAARSARRVTRLVARPAVPRFVRSAASVPMPQIGVGSLIAMTGQAVMAALRALLDAFRPRCAVCWALADFDHRYCAACGAPLGQPRPLPGR
jgi:curved DNA-binding protein CbpA